MNDLNNVYANLVWLSIFTLPLWLLLMSDVQKSFFQWLFCFALLSVLVVPLGGYLAAGAALAYGETLRFAAFTWTENLTFTVRVIFVLGVIGAGWSYGVATLTMSVLKKYSICKTPTSIRT